MSIYNEVCEVYVCSFAYTFIMCVTKTTFCSADNRAASFCEEVWRNCAMTSAFLSKVTFALSWRQQRSSNPACVTFCWANVATTRNTCPTFLISSDHVMCCVTVMDSSHCFVFFIVALQSAILIWMQLWMELVWLWCGWKEFEEGVLFVHKSNSVCCGWKDFEEGVLCLINLCVEVLCVCCKQFCMIWKGKNLRRESS